MIRAVDDAEGSVSMNDVDYINAHSTSTPIGDVAEINGIRLALSQTRNASDEDSTSPLLVSSTKGARGHRSRAYYHGWKNLLNRMCAKDRFIWSNMSPYHKLFIPQ